MSAILKSLELHLTEPVKMDFDMTFNQIQIMVGTNGSGKTFLLKTCYAVTTLAQMVHAMEDKSKAAEVAQFVFDNTFDDQNTDGTIIAKYTSGVCEIRFEKGKVSYLVSRVDGVIPIKYMSSGMRLFTAIGMYLKYRKQAPSQNPEDIMQHMLAMYKLYDVAAVEGLIAKCPYEVPDNIRENLKTSFDFKENIQLLSVDLDKADFYVTHDGNIKYASTFSAGQQAILNMILTSTP